MFAHNYISKCVYYSTSYLKNALFLMFSPCQLNSAQFNSRRIIIYKVFVYEFFLITVAMNIG